MLTNGGARCIAGARLLFGSFVEQRRLHQIAMRTVERGEKTFETIDQGRGRRFGLACHEQLAAAERSRHVFSHRLTRNHSDDDAAHLPRSESKGSSELHDQRDHLTGDQSSR
jgi:uncharacterized protein (DUF58 family)